MAILDLDEIKNLTNKTGAATPQYNVDAKQTVQGQLDNLISQNNPLMQKAAAKGMQYANKRGLINSSMGAGAAQSAMMDYAMPIAQTDAATENQFASQKYGADLAKNMNQQGQTFGMQNMAAQDYYNTQNLARSTSANLQGKYTSAVDEITNNAMVSINEIEVAEGITQAEKDKMIQNTINRRDADLSWSRLLYSNMPTWDFGWVDTLDGAMPNAPGIGG